MDVGLFKKLKDWLGQPNDAASPAGSVHAKIKDIHDNKLQSATGTSADTRVSNTVMGWLNTRIKSWQLVTFTGQATSKTVAISSVDPSKVLVFLNGFYAVGNTGPYTCIGYVSQVNATSIVVAPSVSISSPQYSNMSLIVVELY